MNGKNLHEVCLSCTYRCSAGHDDVASFFEAIVFCNLKSENFHLFTELWDFLGVIRIAGTQNVGTLVFAINFRCIDEEGNITYSWSTQPCPMFSILAGVTGSDDATYDEYNDLIGHFENELNYILEELEAVKKLVGVNTKHTYHFANIVMGYASATTIPSEETEA